ncbi:MAG: NAD(P)H-binding protein [Nocardiaceae bacterium]|nr:NAD(P)H-binding protein [Nocardiaceae bacterium]
MILVTGGTGTVGKPLVENLSKQGLEVRVLTRNPKRANDIAGDLTTGDDLGAALEGVTTIVHCASDTKRFGKTDVAQARNLLAAAKRAGVAHFIYISIVGIEKIPMPYYRIKLEVEKLVEDSGVPFTILRATQFHDLVGTMLLDPQRKLPFVIAPGAQIQPIEVQEVADRLAELAVQSPQGRVTDIGGPTVTTLKDLAKTYVEIQGKKKPVVGLRVPGKLGKALRSGGLTCPDQAVGIGTFAEWARARV